MLSQITISQFTVVDHLDVEFREGLTMITGETGAGKSIVLDALGLCLGDRADAGAIRPGEERAEIHTRFDLSALPGVRRWLAERDLDMGDELLLRRVLNADGRSRAYINGSPSTLQDCAALGEQLVDIHGQHAHQALLRRAQQRALLDAYAGATETSRRVADSARQWREARDELARLRDRQQESADREQLLRYQLQELDELALAEGELAALEEEQQQLENAETIQRQAGDALERCDQYNSAVHQLLAQLDARLHSGKRIDDVRQMLDSAAIQLGEAASELSQYLADRESNPERLSEVSERLDAIYAQARKHRVSPEALLEHQQQLQAELDSLDSSDERLAALEAQANGLHDDWQQEASSLSTARKRAAGKLEKAVAQILGRLAMGSCRFAVQQTRRADSEPHPLGAEDVEFLISTNPGADPQALSKVASGGELSRISLAIQVVTAGSSTLPTLVFDEVDVGIGGAVAEVVGRLLAEIAGRAQVLCVTHLPQVAAQGHRHLRVEKIEDGTRVASSMTGLDGEHRVDEIARMLGGMKISDQLRATAREMLSEGAGAA